MWLTQCCGGRSCSSYVLPQASTARVRSSSAFDMIRVPPSSRGRAEVDRGIHEAQGARDLRVSGVRLLLRIVEQLSSLRVLSCLPHPTPRPLRPPHHATSSFARHSAGRLHRFRLGDPTRYSRSRPFPRTFTPRETTRTLSRWHDSIVRLRQQTSLSR